MDAALAAMARHEPFLLEWIESPPQTNEVRRSAILIAAAHELVARTGLPMVLSELGAGAGLNLIWDHYALAIGSRTLGPADPILTLAPRWTGPRPPDTCPTVAAREGVDLNPLGPATDRLRLLSYIWPDQGDRLARTEAALEALARLRAPVARGDAIGWLAARLATPLSGRLHLVCHTVAWQYFPPEARARGQTLLAHLGMEADGQTPGAGVNLTLWLGGRPETLGRPDFHGRWVAWSPTTPSASRADLV